MITKVVSERGSRARGLLEYLWGPGRFNEHQDPRLVAAWDETFLAQGPRLDSFERGLLAREMEAPLRMHGRPLGEHVYHTSVSIHADDGELSDEQWNEVAQAAAAELGFTGDDGHAVVPWMAMRHGKSEKGNDHIHFVAVLCREDGTVPEIRGDRYKWRNVRQRYAQQWNLRTGRGRGAGMPGQSRAELESALRQGRTEPARSELARTVRAAAAGARSEAEFVRRVRKAGMLIRPRWEQGGHRRAIGYAVALRPDKGSKPVWFGGGKLADDLSLGELRSTWPEPSEEQRADALREWRPPGWKNMPTGQQLHTRRLRAEAWDEATHRIAEVREHLGAVDPHDTAAWNGAARSSAGVLASLATRVEPGHRQQLSRAADALASAAQVGEQQPKPVQVDALAPLAGVARAVADAALVGHGGPIAVAAVTMQLGRLVQALATAHEVAGRREQAERSHRAAEQMLEFVRRSPSPQQQTQARRAQLEQERREREQREARERGEQRPGDRSRDDERRNRDGR